VLRDGLVWLDLNNRPAILDWLRQRVKIISPQP
jgi:molybdopterin-guanine dinucleotide biosynthesis protein B